MSGVATNEVVKCTWTRPFAHVPIRSSLKCNRRTWVRPWVTSHHSLSSVDPFLAIPPRGDHGIGQGRTEQGKRRESVRRASIVGLEYYEVTGVRFTHSFVSRPCLLIDHPPSRRLGHPVLRRI